MYNKVQKVIMIKFTIFLLLLFFLNGCTNDGKGGAISNAYTASAITTNRCANSKVTSVTSSNYTPMLVILLSYNNQKISSPMNTWASKIYGKSKGQLNNYYRELSQNQFEFSEATECNGLASVTLGISHPNVDIGSSTFESKVHPGLALALKELDEKIAFNAYDTNGDGSISPDELLITFIIAGYEDAYEGHHVVNGIWGHQSCVNSSIAPTLDGVTIMSCANGGNYALFGEKHNSQNPHNATIGIIAHELGHSTFGLPDLYLGGGIGVFGLMGAGIWAYTTNHYPGESPTHMSAWSKVHIGWVTPDETNGSKTFNATSLNSYNVVKVQNGSKYYLLENRDNSGYDAGLSILNGFKGGIAIWEIDDTKTTQAHLDNNSVNSDASAQGVYILDAKKGAYIQNGNKGDSTTLFYNTNVNSLINTEVNITNISVPSQTMTLDIN